MLGITPQTERSATATEFINQIVLMRSCRLAVVEGLLYRNFGPVRCASRMLSLLASIDRVARSAGFILVRQRTSIGCGADELQMRSTRLLTYTENRRDSFVI